MNTALPCHIAVYPDEQIGQIEYQEQKGGRVQLDFCRVCTGYLAFHCRCDAPAILVITYGPVTTCMKFTLNITLPAGDFSYADASYIACRYMNWQVRPLSENEPVTCCMESIEWTPSQYDGKHAGGFFCDDELLNRAFSMGAYTGALCVQRNSQAYVTRENNLSLESRRFRDGWKGSCGHNFVLFDGPRRDREAWLGDIRTEALLLYSAMGWWQIGKNSLELFLDQQTPEGYTFGSGTSNQRFLEYNLWLVIALWEYDLYSGDRGFLTAIYPKVEHLWGYLLGQLNQEGFIRGDACWMWTFPREGYGSAIQCILYETMRKGALLAEVMGDTGRQVDLLTRAATLKKRIIERFWDEQRGVLTEVFGLVDTEQPVFLDVNSYAVVFGIVEGEAARRVLTYLREHMWTEYGSATTDRLITKGRLNPDLKTYALKRIITQSEDPAAALRTALYPHNQQVWPFMVGYEVEARLQAGDETGAIELIRLCWGNPAYKETGTFWEMFDIHTGVFADRKISEFDPLDSYNSACHGWSGWVAHLMHRYILGVQPTKAGFRRVAVSPRPGLLRYLCGLVPTPHGVIHVTMEKTEDDWYINISAPAETHIDFLPQSPAFTEGHVFINITKADI